MARRRKSTQKLKLNKVVEKESHYHSEGISIQDVLEPAKLKQFLEIVRGYRLGGLYFLVPSGKNELKGIVVGEMGDGKRTDLTIVGRSVTERRMDAFVSAFKRVYR